MKQSKNAWNIKFMMQLYQNYPKSLCTLFWSQVWTFLWAIVCIPFFVIGLLSHIKDKKVDNYFDTALYGFVLATIITTTLSFLYTLFTWQWNDKNPALFLAVIFIIGCLIIFCFYIVKYIDESDNNIIKSNITSKYIKAKKEKVCPTIQWTE